MMMDEEIFGSGSLLYSHILALCKFQNVGDMCPVLCDSGLLASPS